MKLQANKPIVIPSIAGNPTIPDGVARPYTIKIEQDGTYTVAIHFYATEQDLLDDVQPVRSENFNMALGGVISQIIARAKQQSSLDQATDLP